MSGQAALALKFHPPKDGDGGREPGELKLQSRRPGNPIVYSGRVNVRPKGRAAAMIGPMTAAPPSPEIPSALNRSARSKQIYQRKYKTKQIMVPKREDGIDRWPCMRPKSEWKSCSGQGCPHRGSCGAVAGDPVMDEIMRRLR